MSFGYQASGAISALSNPCVQTIRWLYDDSIDGRERYFVNGTQVGVMPRNKIASIALATLLILSAGAAATGSVTAAPANQTADADQDTNSTTTWTS